MGLWNGFVGVVGLSEWVWGMGFLGFGLSLNKKKWRGWLVDAMGITRRTSSILGGSRTRSVLGGSEWNRGWIKLKGGSEWRKLTVGVSAECGSSDWSSVYGGSPSLSLSLSARLSPEMVWSENRNVKWFPSQNLYFYDQMKCISENSIFHAQPNTQFYRKWFFKMVWSQNKWSLSKVVA